MHPDNLYGVDMTKVMFGVNAVQIPAWTVLQNQGDGITSFIGATRTPMIKFWGRNSVHTLMIGEIVMRPRLAIASNDCIGGGIEDFLRNPFQDGKWLQGIRLVGSDEIIRKLLGDE